MRRILRLIQEQGPITAKDIRRAGIRLVNPGVYLHKLGRLGLARQVAWGQWTSTHEESIT